MEEWERRVAPGQAEEIFEGPSRAGKSTITADREPSYSAGDGLPVLNP